MITILKRQVLCVTFSIYVAIPEVPLRLALNVDKHLLPGLLCPKTDAIPSVIPNRADSVQCGGIASISGDIIIQFMIEATAKALRATPGERRKRRRYTIIGDTQTPKNNNRPGTPPITI